MKLLKKTRIPEVLTDKQLELAEKELAKRKQEQADALQQRQQQCQQEIEAICEKYGMILQAPVTRENILDFTARLFNPQIGAIGVNITVVEKQ